MKTIIDYITEQENFSDEVKKITDAFRQECKDIHGRSYCPYEICYDYSHNAFSVFVEDGDWKHDHGYVKNKMNNLGYKFIDTEEWGDSEDDSYSATHYFVKK